MRVRFWPPLLRRLGLLAMACALPASGAADTVSRLAFAATPGVPIDPRLFGVNYVWHLVPQTEFSRFAAAMRDIGGARLMRFPGGWAAERYDWDRNEEIGETPRAIGPGVDAATFLAAAPLASFVTPSAPAIRDPDRIEDVVRASVALVRRYGGRVGMWEIGNEWWLQRGARQNPETRAQNLAAYAALVARVAPAMKRANPSIAVYVTGEWTRPADFATLRGLVRPEAWSAVDGLSIHPYCGTLEAETLCSLIPARAAEIRAASGKARIYASEWSLGPRVTADDYGIRNANQLVGAIVTLAAAGVEAAAYWPPVRALPQIAFVSTDYEQPFATGLLFGWMARGFRGEMRPLVGDLPAAAARAGGVLSLVVPSMGPGPRRVEISLAGQGVSHVAESEVMLAADPDDRDRSRIVRFAPLDATIWQDADGSPVLAFLLNPATPGRGAGWEIARVVLR